MNLPRETKTVITRHTWTIGSEGEPADAKEFRFGVHYAEQAMAALGVDLSYDDAYHVEAGDGIVLYVDIKKPETIA